VAIQGFSDGASYALSLGLTNGDLFTHVIAFSPGFAAPAEQRGRPRIYVSHGVAQSLGEAPDRVRRKFDLFIASEYPERSWEDYSRAVRERMNQVRDVRHGRAVGTRRRVPHSLLP